MRITQTTLTAFLFALLTSVQIYVQAQPPVLDGLIVQLDAAVLAKEAKPGAVAEWRNQASGTQDFVQIGDPTTAPKLLRIGESFIVRFDGDDYLRSEKNSSEPNDAIAVFVVAAPHENIGDFRGIVAANAAGRRDYESGFTMDLGPGPTRKLENINVEGSGFNGAADLLNKDYDFGTLHVLSALSNTPQSTVKFRVDGNQVGKRSCKPAGISLEELTLGARFYTNGPGDQQVRGQLKCDIAELLIYNRALSVDETSAVEGYLLAKYAKLAEELPGTLELGGQFAQLEKAKDPPALQMLVPGFEVIEIPVELTNVNNVRFRPDGKLFTLGYNGDVHLLSDTDGDGLEDDATLFWKNEGSVRGPIGILVTPKDYPHGQGIFTPSKGKLSLIVDKDGDDRADEEMVVASGWNEIPQNVDATGIAMDEAGYLYFGLGTANYANAFLVNDQGKAEYDLHSDRGTVQRVSPDFKTRETVCTGIRFPIAFAFNTEGDLFCSEQEGATWLANGNPLDELLQIVPDRHYGFPPRHPRHNPNVIDEPSVFDYGPQHQSTCGMVFNHSVNGGPTFGPTSWAGDALMCGESRGKIWRTQLVNTEHGYVANTQLIACLQMLTVDACVAPNGDLVVACHSGPPDWGTGPTGIGKLFRIRMTEAEVARPIHAWANSTQEIQIAFDHPLDPTSVQGIVDEIKIQYGEYVRAGDQFENLVPPYAVVQRQLASPRQELAVLSMALSPDRRNILLQTDAMDANTHYAISIPFASRMTEAEDATLQPNRQIQSIDVDLTLNGVQAEFTGTALPTGELSAAGKARWTGWLPHIDWKISDAMTKQSALHDSLRAMMQAGGTLELRTKLDAIDILRPIVQPGSTLDYQLPQEEVTLHASSTQTFTLVCDTEQIDATRASSGRYEARVRVPASSAASFAVAMRVAVAPNTLPDCTLAVSTNEDERLRALPLRRFFLPWTSEPGKTAAADAVEKIAELEGGNWGKGRNVFHSEAGSCFKCHTSPGSPHTMSGGIMIGPDLGNLVHRDYASVLRDIQNPSFAINPDYLGQVVLMQDGHVLTGVVQSQAGELVIGDVNGKVTRFTKGEIESMKPAEISIMPKGLDEKFTPEQLRDLMTYLLTSPPHMPLDSPLEAPPVRTMAEVSAVLAGAAELTGDLKELSIILVAGDKDHGPGEHDYPAWQIQWAQLLSADASVRIDTAWNFPEDAQLAKADVLIFFQKGAWDDARQQKMDAYFDRGGGAVYIHWAVNGDDRVADFSQRIGLASKGGSIGYRHGPLTLQIHNTDHPIMRNIPSPLQLYDESYWRLTGNTDNVTLFATSAEDGAAQPQLWTYDRSAGRVFVSIPGHYNWTFDDPIFRAILLRGIAWTAKQPVDRFNELVTPGARISK
jgi:putative heme-binding domain-containing protein